MNYWLMKSEPDVYSIDHLKKARNDFWEGVRNYQARNMMRDQMQQGDLAFFYHSNCKLPGIVGIMNILRTAYPDDTAWDPHSKYYDPKASPEHPRWVRVDVRYKRKLKRNISLTELKSHRELQNLALVRKGNRLSIMPVSPQEWEFILELE